MSFSLKGLGDKTAPFEVEVDGEIVKGKYRLNADNSEFKQKQAEIVAFDIEGKSEEQIKSYLESTYELASKRLVEIETEDEGVVKITAAALKERDVPTDWLMLLLNQIAEQRLPKSKNARR